ncbi:FecR domain-containing protein [Agrobacterium sp. a22-2]|uniref:FecR domain-containing protein n=1 Tax=Agrobacterium sp. a22-2 TaxID=2283840 RepID=UPI0034CD2C0A
MKIVSCANLLAFLALSLLVPATAMAQDAACQREQLPEPPRVIYRCPNGLVLEAEAAANLDLAEQPGQQRPAAASLSDKALLIEVEPGSGPFQILTPHAIAAVRGTAYAVDVTRDATSVFVIRGEVGVSRTDGSQAVTLRPGEGVDVSAAQPLTVKVWGQQRVESLLARFAR